MESFLVSHFCIHSNWLDLAVEAACQSTQGLCLLDGLPDHSAFRLLHLLYLTTKLWGHVQRVALALLADSALAHESAIRPSLRAF